MAERLPESVLLSNVLELAERLHWHRAHFRPAMTKWGWRTAVSGDGKGFPDLVLLRERVVWAELKRVGEKLSPEQEAWQQWLEDAGQEHYVWTDEDWEEIVRVLELRDGA